MQKRTQRPKGIALLMSALLLGVLIAFVGLAVDLGYWVATRSQLQTAADLAALAAAQDLDADGAASARVARAAGAAGRANAATSGGAPDRADAAGAARAAGAGLACAELNGAAASETTVAVEGQRVEVEIRRRAPGFFSRIFGHRELTLTVRAAAAQMGGRVVLVE